MLGTDRLVTAEEIAEGLDGRVQARGWLGWTRTLSRAEWIRLGAFGAAAIGLCHPHNSTHA